MPAAIAASGFSNSPSRQRANIREIEDCLRQAEEACRAGDMAATATEIGSALQLVGESLRNELGLYF
jgi:hypothetical protein